MDVELSHQELLERLQKAENRIFELEARPEIKDHEHSAEAIHASEQRLRRALSVAKICSWEWNCSGGLIDWTDHVYDMFGFDRKYRPTIEWIGTRIHPDERADFCKAIEELETNPRSTEMEYRVILPNGQLRHMHTAVEVEHDDRGAPFRLVGIVQDVTERKEAEERLLTIEAQLSRAQKLESLGVLAGGIAHDFNNLLAVIFGNAELALDDIEPGTDTHQNLDEIMEATRKAMKLISQMLAYAGRGGSEARQVDLSEVVGGMSSLLETAVSRKVTFEADLARELPTIEADVGQLRQVIMNLTTNAGESFDSDQGGSVRVSTRARWFSREELSESFLDEQQPAGRYVMLSVEDDGHGMDAETKKRMFDPFFTTKFPGRGLGLASTLGIIRSHHGTVFVESAPTRGTSIKVLFPAMSSTHTPEAPRPEDTLDSSSGESDLILVVDDDRAVRRLACKLLKRGGFRTLEASDGINALEILEGRRREIEVVLLDLTMPNMSGAEVLRELGNWESRPPVVLMTGYNDDKLAETVSLRKNLTVIRKPFSSRELLAAITSIVEGGPTIRGVNRDHTL